MLIFIEAQESFNIANRARRRLYATEPQSPSACAANKMFSQAAATAQIFSISRTLESLGLSTPTAISAGEPQGLGAFLSEGFFTQLRKPGFPWIEPWDLAQLAASAAGQDHEAPWPHFIMIRSLNRCIQ